MKGLFYLALWSLLASTSGRSLANASNHAIFGITDFAAIVSDSIPSTTSRFSFDIDLGMVLRAPTNDSFYRLWRDLAIDGQLTEQSSGLSNHIATRWPDLFSFFSRVDIDYLIWKNLSMGVFAYSDLYKKHLSFSGETDNWTGNGSNGLEDHWELRRKLRLATYNFGPDLKLRMPLKHGIMTLSYLYGWSYLLRSAYEFSYFNQQTGTGEKGFLGLLFASDGNLTKIRYQGHTNLHRVELAFSKSKGKNGSLGLSIGYQFLKMENIRFRVLKFDSEVLLEAMRYFEIRQFQGYEIGDEGDVMLDNEKFVLDLSSFYLTLTYQLHYPNH